jgi:hypothetical protein
MRPISRSIFARHFVWDRRPARRISADGATVPPLIDAATLENAQLMAAHESPRTTKLYDRTGDEITLDEVERIAI